MDKTEVQKNQKILKVGYVLIFISLFILIISGLYRNPGSFMFEDNGLFFINFVISIIFFGVMLFSNRPFLKFWKIDRRVFTISLTLFSISAFSLNHSLVLFSKFETWVILYLVLFYSALISLNFYPKLSPVLRIVSFFFLGAGFVLIVYFAAYLAPTYGIAILGSFILGLSLHLLAPVFVAITVIFHFSWLGKLRTDKIAFYAGIILPLIITVVFMVKWNNFKKDIHEANSSIITRPDSQLPEWILLCQNMPTDNFSGKIIKGNLMYETFQNMWGGWGTGSFDEVRRHNPLINVCMSFLGDADLDRNSRVKILKSQYNARHLAQRKLWTGRDLETVDVLNSVQIIPEYRLAYTEKIITIKNLNQWENNQQEAAFTFYLPEGSVATSLSLWIEGKEEKSRLTTKSKADSAYVSIVGVERRDPALMHWQEGNTLTVTVFPCTPKENRKFKIGITSPLEIKDKALIYKSIYFDGPVSKGILETSSVEIVSENPVMNLDIPQGFKQKGEANFIYTGKFRPYWEIKYPLTDLSSKHFSFNNKGYQITPLEKEYMSLDPKNVYLDINKSWTKGDFDAVLDQCKEKRVYVFYDKIIQINTRNKDQMFDLLQQQNFSLFPFHEINDLQSSLVISKSTELSPNLSDLEGTKFLDSLYASINSGNERINLYQLGEYTSPYLKTLKELQLFNFNSGSIASLTKALQEQQFVRSNEDPLQVDLDIAGISIIQNQETKSSGAPDHLLRMFAYNKIMKSFGRNYFNKDDSYIDSLVGIANEAYVVSPVSSLVVLETQKDYERFGIDENENSLKNASASSAGSIPEPSEWLLIILFASTVLFLLYKRKKQLKLKWK